MRYFVGKNFFSVTTQSVPDEPSIEVNENVFNLLRASREFGGNGFLAERERVFRELEYYHQRIEFLK